MCLHLGSVVPMVAQMFKPALKDLAYYFPLNEFKSDLQLSHTPVDFGQPFSDGNWYEIGPMVSRGWGGWFICPLPL